MFNPSYSPYGEFRGGFRRRNVLLDTIYSFFWSIVSYPRLVMEVFIRVKPGRRYFNMASALTVLFILCIIPYWLWKAKLFHDNFYGHQSNGYFWWKYITWYVFAAAFTYFSYKRLKEVFWTNDVYKLNYYSLSTGYTDPKILEWPVFKDAKSEFQLTTKLEPALFFIPGLLLYLVGQPVGMLLMIVAVCYSISYYAAYKQADNYYQNLIDRWIVAQEMEKAFIYGQHPSSTRGVIYQFRPEHEALRRTLYPQFRRNAGVEDIDYTVE